MTPVCFFSVIPQPSCTEKNIGLYPIDLCKVTSGNFHNQFFPLTIFAPVFNILKITY
jgi:hypothetical protein